MKNLLLFALCTIYCNLKSSVSNKCRGIYSSLVDAGDEKVTRLSIAFIYLMAAVIYTAYQFC